MMLDTDVVAASPLSVYRVLSDAGLIKRHNTKASLKETSFQQPLAPHEHWHVDIAYINVSDVETIIQRAQESYPGVSPRIISNGAQFIARDFKEFIRICGMTHVRTSPYYPQSNSKIERWYRSIKSECIRPGTPRCGHGDRWISVLKRLRLHEHGTRKIGSSNLRSLIEKHSAGIRANAFCLFNILLDLTMKIDRGL
jgi:hypothetical protein